MRWEKKSHLAEVDGGPSRILYEESPERERVVLSIMLDGEWRHWLISAVAIVHVNMDPTFTERCVFRIHVSSGLIHV